MGCKGVLLVQGARPCPAPCTQVRTAQKCLLWPCSIGSAVVWCVRAAADTASLQGGSLAPPFPRPKQQIHPHGLSCTTLCRGCIFCAGAGRLWWQRRWRGPAPCQGSRCAQSDRSTAAGPGRCAGQRQAQPAQRGVDQAHPMGSEPQRCRLRWEGANGLAPTAPHLVAFATAPVCRAAGLRAADALRCCTSENKTVQWPAVALGCRAGNGGAGRSRQSIETLRPCNGQGAMPWVAVQRPRAAQGWQAAGLAGPRQRVCRLCPVRPVPYSTVNSFWLSSGRRFLPVPLLAIACAQEA